MQDKVAKVKLPTKAHEKMRIAGRLVDADERLDVLNPYTGAVVGTVPACPPFPILGVPSFLLPVGPTPIIATVPVGPGGAVLLPTFLPPGLPVGVSLYDQWFILKPLGPSPLQVSNGAHFRISLP